MKKQDDSTNRCLLLKLALIAAFSISSLFAADSTVTRWVAINGGYNSSDKASCWKITALKVDKSGTLYAGGTFRNISGDTITSIAKYKDGDWEQLGQGLTGTVYSILFDTSGLLYAGGSFKVNELSVKCCVASWDGVKWDTIGYGANITGTVKDFAFDTLGNLLAAGSLAFSGDSGSFYDVGRWDGQKWNKFLKDIIMPGTIYTIAATRWALEIGGYFKIPMGDDTLKSIVSVDWDGHVNYMINKSVEKSDADFKPITGYVYDLASSSDLNTEYITGDFVVIGGIRHYGFNKSLALEFVGGKGVGYALEPVGNDGVFLAGSFTTGYSSTTLMYTGNKFGDFNALMRKTSTDDHIRYLAYDSVYNRIYAGGGI